MWRRPEYDHCEERKCGEVEGPRCRGPADQRRHGTSRATNDDVQRRRALEPDRVHEDVDERARQREGGGKRVRPPPQDHECERIERDANGQRVPGRDASARHWTPARPAHLGVDVSIELRLVHFDRQLDELLTWGSLEGLDGRLHRGRSVPGRSAAPATLPVNDPSGRGVLSEPPADPADGRSPLVLGQGQPGVLVGVEHQ